MVLLEWVQRAHPLYVDRLVSYGVDAARGQPPKFERSAYYVRAAFDASGDNTAHLRVPPAKKVEHSTPEFSLARVPAAARALDAFSQAAAERGARVFLTYPFIPESSYAESREGLAALDAALREAVHLPVLDTPGECVLPDALFYDSMYHLGAEGIARRSEHLIQALQRAQVGPPR